MANDDLFSMSAHAEEYFAQKEPEKLAGILLGKAKSFFNLLEANAYLDKLNRMWRAYHGLYSVDTGYGHAINFTGEQGELVNFPVNHFRNLAQHIFVMITSNRPVMDARAINTDYKSLAQTGLANGILDYYMREKRLEEKLKRAAEYAIVFGSGFVKMEWNATAGEAYDVDPDTGQFVREGELEFSNLSPFDVIVDGTKESWDHDWIMTRTFKNRFNLMAKYPELAEKIKGLPPKSFSGTYRLAVFSNDETDDIPVYEFYHKRTEAMPEGRYMLFLESDIALLDTKMPYRVIPIFRMSPSDILGTPYGYSPMFDIFPIQELINSTYSTIATNQNAFGVQSLWVPKGADISLASLEGGMNVIESSVKPEGIQLTQTAPEVFKYLEMLIQAAETISGVGSVARGAPEASLKSGTALALVQSMSLQFISGLQQSYVKLIEDAGTAIISILKDFANTPKVIAIVGKNNKTLLKEFTGEEISAINRVVVDVGNPLSRTIAGRVQMAQDLLQMNAIKNPEEYFQVLNTGKLEITFEGELRELYLIRSENERLMEGKQVLISPLEKHRLHIKEHNSVLADPDFKEDAALVKNVLDHIEGHLNALRNTDPDLLTIIGEQPLGPPGGSPAGPQQIPPMPPGMPEPQMLNNTAQTTANPPSMPAGGMPDMPQPPGEFANQPVLASEMAPPNLG